MNKLTGRCHVLLLSLLLLRMATTTLAFHCQGQCYAAWSTPWESKCMLVGDPWDGSRPDYPCRACPQCETEICQSECHAELEVPWDTKCSYVDDPWDSTRLKYPCRGCNECETAMCQGECSDPTLAWDTKCSYIGDPWDASRPEHPCRGCSECETAMCQGQCYAAHSTPWETKCGYVKDVWDGSRPNHPCNGCPECLALTSTSSTTSSSTTTSTTTTTTTSSSTTSTTSTTSSSTTTSTTTTTTTSSTTTSTTSTTSSSTTTTLTTSSTTTSTTSSSTTTSTTSTTSITTSTSSTTTTSTTSTTPTTTTSSMTTTTSTTTTSTCGGYIKQIGSINTNHGAATIPLMHGGNSIVIIGPPSFNGTQSAVSRVRYRQDRNDLRAFVAEPGTTELVVAARATVTELEVENIDWFEEGKEVVVDDGESRERAVITAFEAPRFSYMEHPVVRAVTSGWIIHLESPLVREHPVGTKIRPSDHPHKYEKFSYAVFEKGNGHQHFASTVRIGSVAKDVSFPWMGPNPFVFASSRSGTRNHRYASIRLESIFTPFDSSWQKFQISLQTYKADPKPIQPENVDFVVVRSGCSEDQCTCKDFKNNVDLMQKIMCIKNAGAQIIGNKSYSFETGIFWSKEWESVRDWNTVKFHTRFKSPPIVLANVQTDMSTNKDPYNIRLRTVSRDEFEFIIDEETDRAHVGEWVAYYAIGEARYSSDSCWLKAEKQYNTGIVPHNAPFAPPSCERYKALLEDAQGGLYTECGENLAGIEEYRQLCSEFGCGADCSSRRLLMV